MESRSCISVSFSSLGASAYAACSGEDDSPKLVGKELRGFGGSGYLMSTAVLASNGLEENKEYKKH